MTVGEGKKERKIEDNHLVDGEILVQMRFQADGVGAVAEGFQSPQLLLLQQQPVGIHLENESYKFIITHASPELIN